MNTSQVRARRILKLLSPCVAPPWELAASQSAPVIGRGFPLGTSYGSSRLSRCNFLQFRKSHQLVVEKTVPGAHLGATKSMNMVTAINDALKIIMRTDKKSFLFGEDVAFGGVFRCSVSLMEEFGADRVLNMPITEQGIVAFGIGMAAEGCTALAEVQFADYIFPAFDQIVNEAAKFRYRSGGVWDCGGLVIRTPCGAVGHGGLYHSQSIEGFFAHASGLKLVVPRGAYQAKGLLISSARDKNPVIFQEPKNLYRLSVDDVPEKDYELPLSEADIVQSGTDITIVSWGAQVHRVMMAAKIAAKEKNISVEVIDLQTILPWDIETVTKSVKKTGRLIVSHEAPRTMGFGAEIAATVHEFCLDSLVAPIRRVTGYDTPFPMIYEPLYLPSVYKVLECIYKFYSV